MRDGLMHPERDGEQGVDVELGPVVSFLRTIWALDHALARNSKRLHRAMGITGTQRFVLRLVARNPGMSAGQLAEVLHLDPSTLTGALSRLEARGALERFVDAKDARRALFRVGAAGRRWLAQNRERTVETCVRKALRRLAPEEVTTAVRVLGALVEALDESAS